MGKDIINPEDSNLDKPSVEEEIDNSVDSDKESTTVDITETEEFKKAVSEKVEAAVNDRVGRASRKLRETEVELEAIKKAKEEIEQNFLNSSDELEKLKTENRKMVVASKTGLSLEIIESLKGESEEELLEAAARIALISDSEDHFKGKNYGSEAAIFQSDLEALKAIQ